MMWANHDAANIWDLRISHLEDNITWQGAVDRREFELIACRLIEKNSRDPCYYTIDGKPVFMLSDPSNLVSGLGGVEHTADAFSWLRAQAIKTGFKRLHLQLVNTGADNLNLSGIDIE